MTTPTTNLFVYGILMRDATESATLPDYHLDFGTFATVVPEPGAVTYGGLVRNVSRAQLRYYDGVEGYRPGDRESYYLRKPVTLLGDVAAEAYVMQPRFLAHAKAAGFPLVSYLAETMHREYDRLFAPAAAHEELDRRLARWGDETRDARRRTTQLWYQDAKP